MYNTAYTPNKPLQCNSLCRDCTVNYSPLDAVYSLHLKAGLEDVQTGNKTKREINVKEGKEVTVQHANPRCKPSPGSQPLQLHTREVFKRVLTNIANLTQV